jgi:hypothetical protein
MANARFKYGTTDASLHGYADLARIDPESCLSPLLSFAAAFSPQARRTSVSVRFWRGRQPLGFPANRVVKGDVTAGPLAEYYWRSSDGFAALQLYQQYWAAKSPDVDVYQIDVIWQGIAAPHAVDLKKYY